MARETKVGLLAGLAFIICFAVILANRGRDDSVSATKSGIPESTGPLPSTIQQQMASRPPAPAVVPDRPASATREPAPATGADLPQPTAPGVVFTDASSAPGSHPSPAQAPDLAEIPPRSLTSHAQPDPIASGVGAPPPDTVAGAKAAARGTAYTVAPGDTLSKIALAHFGNKSRSSVNAIFEANKAVLSSPDAVKAGMVLTLPVIEHASAAASATPPPTILASAPAPAGSLKARHDTAKPASSKKPEKPEAAFRWYQVKKNDRYVSIARDQLGDGGRWRELHEINKDKFPDPQMIREGVRIKVPATKARSEKGGRPVALVEVQR